MKEPHNIIKHERPLEKTVNLKKLIGKSVLSKGGKVIGKILEIRISPNTLALEGILVRGNIIRKPIYIGRSYFSRLSEEAVILNIEVSVLIKDKQVMDFEGKILGTVKEVVRKGTRNDLKGLYVSSLFSKKFFIPASAIQYVSKSVVLRKNYNARKKYFWQKNK